MAARLMMIGVVMTGMGVWMLLPTLKAKEQVDVRLSQLAMDRELKSYWIKTSGHFIWDDVIEVRKGSSPQWYYVPFVTDSWVPGDEYPAIVMISPFGEISENEPDFATIDGLIDPLGVPLHVRAMFDNSIAKNAVLIDEGDDPRVRAKFAKILILIGLAGLGGGGLIFARSGPSFSSGDWEPKKERQKTEKELARESAANHNRDDMIANWMATKGLNTPNSEADVHDSAAVSENVQV